MVANGLAHTALSMVNLQKEFVSAPLINCDPETDISTCVAMDDLDGAGLKDLVEIFVRLQAICTALAHSQRIGISEKVYCSTSFLLYKRLKPKSYLSTGVFCPKYSLTFY